MSYFLNLDQHDDGSEEENISNSSVNEDEVSSFVAKSAVTFRLAKILFASFTGREIIVKARGLYFP
jgi:hypothetical protein